MPKRVLDDIFSENDDLGLLDVALLKRKATSGNLCASQFEEITTFYENYGKVPNDNADSFEEKRLARRLKAFKSNPDQREILKDFDPFGLLLDESSSNIIAPVEAIHPLPLESSITHELNKSELVTSLDDIFEDDDDLLEFDAPDIFTMQHIPSEKKTLPDEIAKRQPCADFSRYVSIFEVTQTELKAGSAKLERFRHELKMNVGDLFILNGVMGYVHSAGERLEKYSSYNARLHLVFENGTELYMLFQSLTHGLVRDEHGYKIMRDGPLLEPSENKVPTGTVYVLATKSTDSILKPYKANLYKVGFTESTIEDRVKYAEKDRTFLEAPVRIVMTAECYNIDAHKLETLIHGFLGNQRLNITLKSYNGCNYKPREWFHAPLATVLEVIEHILDGTISLYRMDNTTGKILKK